MQSYIDISAQPIDPLDDFRLFDPTMEREATQRLIDRLLPRAAYGRCLLSPPPYYLLARGAQDMRAVNDFVLRQWARCGAVAGCFGVSEPKYGEKGIAELDRIAGLGMKGVLWSPRAQGMFGDDPLLAELCRHAHKRGLRSMVRAASFSTNEALWRTWRLASQCPDIPIIVTGALRNWDNARMIAHERGGPGNVHYDTAGWTVSTDLARMVSLLGERLMFGTGGTETGDAGADRVTTSMRRADVSEAMIEAVLGGNAVRLFGLDGETA